MMGMAMMPPIIGVMRVPPCFLMTAGSGAFADHVARLIDEKDVLMVTALLMIVFEPYAVSAPIVSSAMVSTASTVRVHGGIRQNEGSDGEGGRERFS
jgi:hypothetical protein